MSAAGHNFTRSARTASSQSDWKKTYQLLNGLSMDDMLNSMSTLPSPVFERMYAQRVHFKKDFDIPRIEFAVFVVRNRTLPPTNPPPGVKGTTQVDAARKFIASYLKRNHNRVHSNLSRSRSAVNFALKKSKIKGANWDQWDGSNPSAYETTLDRKDMDSVDICLYDNVRPAVKKNPAASKSVIDWLRVTAAESRKQGCANCGEFAAVAFVYLLDLGVRPLDYMSLKGQDHAFVVIGRKAGDPSKASNWGPFAVVCDPWGAGLRGGDTATGSYHAIFFDTSMGMAGLAPGYTGIQSHARV